MTEEGKKLSLAERKKERKIDYMLSVARHLFQRKGYDNTTVEELCDDAMISRSTFFNYFGSKEQLIFLINEREVQDLSIFIDELLEDESSEPLDIIRQYFNKIINSTINYSEITAVFYQLAMRNSEFSTLLKGYHAIEHKIIKNAVNKDLFKEEWTPELIEKIFHGCYIDIVTTVPTETARAEFNQSLERAMAAMLK